MSEEEILRNEDEEYLPLRLASVSAKSVQKKAFNKETRAER